MVCIHTIQRGQLRHTTRLLLMGILDHICPTSYTGAVAIVCMYTWMDLVLEIEQDPDSRLYLADYLSCTINRYSVTASGPWLRSVYIMQELISRNLSLGSSIQCSYTYIRTSL